MNRLRMEKLTIVTRAVKATVFMAMALATASVAWGLDIQTLRWSGLRKGERSRKSVWPSGKLRMTWSLCRPVSL